MRSFGTRSSIFHHLRVSGKVAVAIVVEDRQPREGMAPSVTFGGNDTLNHRSHREIYCFLSSHTNLT